MLFTTPITETLEAVESNILLNTEDKDLLDYRTAQMELCSMTGLAGALVAQVAGSSLQLEYVSTIHWIVPALFTTSLTIGLLCVHYSFILHYSLTRWGSARSLRTAFTHCPSPVPTGVLRSAVGTAEQGEDGGRPKPSYQTVLKLSLPSYLLVVAITMYITTIFMYWGIAGVMDLQGSGGRSWGVGLHLLKLSSAPQADNEFLDHCILHTGNMGDFNYLGGGVWGVWG